MNVAEYVANWLAENTSGRCYGVVGGARMWLDDAICHHPKLTFTAMHHEQAAAFACEADARVSGQLSSVHVTAGPGVTNAMTGVACAYADSLPMLVIAGQAESRTLRQFHEHYRQGGISEVDGATLMSPITKKVLRLSSPDRAVAFLNAAKHEAMTGRRGPVYLEIPLDVQNAELGEQVKFHLWHYEAPALMSYDIEQCFRMLLAAERPVLLVGHGVRLADAKDELMRFIGMNPTLPVLTTWSGADLIADWWPSYVGRPGIIGDRAGNFAIQNADLILAIGTRLSIPQIGHAHELFAPRAKLIMVDIDEQEMIKPTLNVALPIHADAKAFLREIAAFIKKDWRKWRDQCVRWRCDHPVIQKKHAETTDGINVYHFLDLLAQKADENAIIVTDVGQAFVCTMQAMRATGNNRFFHSPGIAPMGYGLPAAIGAAIATDGNREVICLTGDGGSMFNLHALGTVAEMNLPIAIFLYENGGYRTMQVTQKNHFNRYSADPRFPDFRALIGAFQIDDWIEVRTHNDLPRAINFTLEDRSGPHFCLMRISPSMEIEPLVKTRMEAGKFVPTPLDCMYPYLDEKVPA